MRILPDAKDLINIVEHDVGVTFDDLEQFLSNGQHKIVLTSTNVMEFVAPLSDNGDFLQMRTLLQKLERLPLCYMKETDIPLKELRAAKAAFDQKHNYQQIDPYVNRWDDTISVSDKPTPTSPLVALRLDEIIYMIWKKDPTIFRFPSKEIGSLIRDQYQAKRQSTPAPRALVKKEFGKYVQQQFRTWGLDTDSTNLLELADWIYSDPNRCPGLRIFHDMRYEIIGAVTDKLNDNDTQDFAYLYAIPYVDAVTLDRRIRGYSDAVSQRLKKMTPSVDYTNRLFHTLGAVIEANP